jgi:hypothetical protein
MDPARANLFGVIFRGGPGVTNTFLNPQRKRVVVVGKLFRQQDILFS